MVIAGQQHLASRRRLRLFSPHRPLLLQVLEQRDQTGQRRHPPLTARSSSDQEFLGHRRRELDDLTAFDHEPAVELAHQDQVVLHRLRWMIQPQQLLPKAVRERRQGPRARRP